MQGQLLNFSPQENTGYISGDDGKRYQFLGSEWKENQTPQKGDHLDFEVDASGQAVSVFFALNHTTQTNNNANFTSQSLPIDSNIEALYATEAEYNMFDWFFKCVKKYASFSGRARRKEYWYFILCTFILGIIASIIGVALDIGYLLNDAINLVLFLPSLGVAIRRLHDVNRSGWWFLIIFTIIGVIFYIIWLATDTKPEVNKWGAPAKPQNN